jgi:hypothetical protein
VFRKYRIVKSSITFMPLQPRLDWFNYWNAENRDDGADTFSGTAPST